MLTPSDSALDSDFGPEPTGTEADLRQAGDELERRIRAGEAARAEEYLRLHAALAADPEWALDLIYLEYATRRATGQAPPREEFFARFPQWRAELERQFQLEELLDEPTPPGVASESDLASFPYAARGGSSDRRFRVLRLLARGGIGQVMRAVDTELNREVAVKELQPALAESDEARERFLREAEITGKLEHPGVVPIYGLGSDTAGRPFYAMRLVNGQSLEEAIQEFHQRPTHDRQFFSVEFQKLLRRYLHVCETVAYAHSRGIIHRDLKPANILLGPFDETLVVDWGLARAMCPGGPQPAAPEASCESRPIESIDSRAHWLNDLTRASGELIGTPAFMSPEQASGKADGVGPASDVYSLGATLYMLLTGQAPFGGSCVEESLRQVIAGNFAPPRKLSRAIPASLEAICLKAMSRRPEDRYASPRELAEDVEHWLADEPVTAMREPIIARIARWGRRNRPRVVAGLIALVLITIVSVVAAIRINSERLRADGERIEANRQRIDADRQRAEADRQRIAADAERNEANRRNARLAFDRGVALTRDHEHGEGMLWFARALQLAPDDDAALRRVILTNLDAARHFLLNRRATFANVNLGRMAFSPDGKRLVTTSVRETARLWDVESGAMLSERKLQSRSSGNVVALHVFNDGSALIALESGPTISVQRLPADGASPAEPAGALRHDEKIACAEFSLDGTVLAAGSSTDGPSKTRLWQLGDSEPLADFNHPATVRQIVFRPQTRQIATVGSDGRVRLWAMTDGRPSHEGHVPVREIKPESRQIHTIAFTPSGKRMLAGDTTGTVSDWDADTGRRLPDLAHQSGIVTAIAVASDGQTVLTAWDTGVARVWNLASRATFCELLRLDRFAGQLAIRPGTRQLLIATEPQAVMLWDIPDPARLAPVLSQPQVSAIAFSPDGQKAITGSRDKTARLRHVQSGRVIRGVGAMTHGDMVSQVAFRPDGEVVLTASDDGTARLWSARNGRKHGQVMNHPSASGGQVQVQAAAFSPDGQFVLTGDRSGVLRIWNGDTGEQVRIFDPITDQPSGIRSVSFSPEGHRVVAGFTGGQVGLWDARTGRLTRSVSHSDAVRDVSFSPRDGRLVLSAGNDGTARFWNADDGQPVGAEMRHRGQVFVARFSPDGRLAVTGGFDATVRFWEVPSGREVGEPMRHEGVVATASFSRDSTRLLTGGTRDRTARLWDVATCLPLAPPLEHDSDVFAVAIHPDGHTALTGRFWRLPAPLPDDPALVDLWVQLATQRTFTAGNNIEWLTPAALTELARAFESRAGQPWREWAD
jgi:eukaryotic-like serine/threonine-protein kinase